MLVHAQAPFGVTISQEVVIHYVQTQTNMEISLIIEYVKHVTLTVQLARICLTFAQVAAHLCI